MTREEVIGVIKKHIMDNLEDLEESEIDPGKSMKDYGANSLDIIEVVSCSMRELKIKVPRAELSEIERKQHKQTESVFTYLVSDIGETLDVNRFPTDENDLLEMVSLFNQFKGSKNSFRTNSKRCKIQPISKFNPKISWAVDRWWTIEEKVELKIKPRQVLLTIDEFKEKVKTIEDELHQMTKMLRTIT